MCILWRRSQIGLVVSVRCVATCEGGNRVSGLCLAQTPFSFPDPSSPKNFPSGGFLVRILGFAIDYAGALLVMRAPETDCSLSRAGASQLLVSGGGPSLFYS